MNLLTQIILAARNRDSEGIGWMRILIFVVMGVLWALGGIAKARANKADQQDNDQPSRKPGFKPPPKAPKTSYQKVQSPLISRPAHEHPRPQIRPPHREVMRPQPAARKFTTKKEQVNRPQASEASELSPLSPQLQPDLEKFPEFTSESVKKLGDKRIAIAAETTQAKYLAEILSDYADPDNLRRAILHYEILGKPLSLRPSSGPIIRL